MISFSSDSADDSENLKKKNEKNFLSYLFKVIPCMTGKDSISKQAIWKYFQINSGFLLLCCWKSHFCLQDNSKTKDHKALLTRLPTTKHFIRISPAAIISNSHNIIFIMVSKYHLYLKNTSLHHIYRDMKYLLGIASQNVQMRYFKYFFKVLCLFRMCINIEMGNYDVFLLLWACFLT